MAKTNYTILLICEGENTEPQIFNSIRDRIYSGDYNIDAKIKIVPEPKIEEENLPEIQQNIHKKKRKKRKLKPAKGEEPKVIKGVPPLKWVLAGQEELNDGTYDEVWTVFDNDNHPAKKEAFEKAKESINGKSVKIAFSSRSIEYYFLIHFERKYYCFPKTECKEYKISIQCGTDSHTNDCKGTICINGYARKNKYWDDSKGKKSFFDLIEDKLITGFQNAAWVRYKSNIHEGKKEIFDRNPYLTVDFLIKRLTGYEDYIWNWFSGNTSNNGLSIKVQNHEIEITNISSIAKIIPQDSFFKTDDIGISKTNFGNRKVIEPGESFVVNIQDYVTMGKTNYFGFEFRKEISMFEI